MKKPSCINTPVPPRKAPKIRNYQNDELEEFRKTDIIERVEDLTEKRFRQLENFSNKIATAPSENKYSLIDELEKRRHYKPTGRPPYLANLIRYALLLRYTSLAAYKQLLDKFPLPSPEVTITGSWLADEISKAISSHQSEDNHLSEATLCEESIEVASTVAGYIAKK